MEALRGLTKPAGCSRAAALATIGAALTMMVCAVSARADTLQIEIQSSSPEQGIPASIQLSGEAGAIDQYGKGPYLYAVVRPQGGLGCQDSFGADEAGAGSASAVLEGADNEVGPGHFAVQTTYNPPSPGAYVVCAWLEDAWGDGSGEPATANEVLVGPKTAAFSARGPQVGELRVALASPALPGVGFHIDYTTQTDQQLELYSAIKRAGGLPCASSYQLEQEQNQADEPVFFDAASVFGGPLLTTGSASESAAGPYTICSWIEGPSNAEVDAATTTNIYVGLSAAACIVPKVRRGASLAAAERKLLVHHCRLGLVEHAFSREVHKGAVVALRPGAGKHRAAGAKVDVVVSAGPKPRRKGRRR